MFAHRRGKCKRTSYALFPLALALALGACGGGSSSGGESAEGADPEAVAVITEWADALREGDVEAAAALFALPSVAENGAVVVPIDSREDAVAFNRSLPCGGVVVATESAGESTVATFRLTERPGGDCGRGTGGLAATSFQVDEGEIVEWRRVPLDRGDPAPAMGETV